MAGKTSSERVSVKGYLVPYLQEIGRSIGTDDLSEVVNHLLTCQKLGCFGSPQTPVSASVPQSKQASTAAAQDVLGDDALIDGLSDLLAA